MKKKSNITAQTKAKIVKTFIKLCLEEKPNKITVTKIIAKAKYNRSTFYEYFQSIDDLYSQIEQELLERIEFLIKETHTNIINNKGRALNERPYKTIALYTNALIRYSGNPALVTKIKKIVKRVLIDTYNTKSINNISNNYVMEFVINGMIGVYIHWANSKFDLKVHELKKIMLPFIMVLTNSLLEEKETPL